MLMFRVLLFFIFASSSFGLSITLNNGKTGGNNYYILHIENEREFSCQVKIGRFNSLENGYLGSREKAAQSESTNGLADFTSSL